MGVSPLHLTLCATAFLLFTKEECVVMALTLFDGLPPYFGNKRKLCPVIFNRIAKFFQREQWAGATFVDAFLGSGAASLYAKAQGFRVIANDIAERSVIAGKALIENNGVKLTESDLHQLFIPNPDNQHLIEREFVPDVFPLRHARFLDNAFANAKTPNQRYPLMKYIFSVRPYSKFSSPNAFNRPFESGDFDKIKPTYLGHIKDNLKSPLEILKREMLSINTSIISNGQKNEVHKSDVFDFIDKVDGNILYLDPPYAGTLAYEAEYAVLDTILGDSKTVSKFSSDDGADMLDALLAKAEKFPLWVISFGNAGGKNDLNKLVEMVRKYRQCEYWSFAYTHCGAMASEEHKQQSREWVLIGYKNS